MPATIITREVFPSETSDAALQTEMELRIKAGAIRSWIEKSDGNKILCTEWNIIGSND
jgi:hypothetical protein